MTRDAVDMLMALAVLVGMGYFIYKVAPALWASLRDAEVKAGKPPRRIAFGDRRGRYLYHVAVLVIVLLHAVAFAVVAGAQLLSGGRLF